MLENKILRLKIGKLKPKVYYLVRGLTILELK